uniref:Uncharacterized protein n=1 Tax=Rangifer tarandus platyrhynchus TaxID=3082113 RepID=A0ACB0E548_RANTA|nr:unnamed protein product [Rangifer tarandus platyrhynchus]
MGHTSGLEPGGSVEEACLGLPAWSQVTASGMLASKHSLHVRHWARSLPSILAVIKLASVVQRAANRLSDHLLPGCSEWADWLQRKPAKKTGGVPETCTFNFLFTTPEGEPWGPALRESALLLLPLRSLTL